MQKKRHIVKEIKAGRVLALSPYIKRSKSYFLRKHFRVYCMPLRGLLKRERAIWHFSLPRADSGFAIERSPSDLDLE